MLLILNSILSFMSVGFYTRNMQKHGISQKGPGYEKVINNLKTSMAKASKQPKIQNCRFFSSSMHLMQVSCRLWFMSADYNIQAARAAAILKVANSNGREKNITRN